MERRTHLENEDGNGISMGYIRREYPAAVSRSAAVRKSAVTRPTVRDERYVREDWSSAARKLIFEQRERFQLFIR